MKIKFILVADDDEDDQELIRVALSDLKKNLEIIILRNGVEALDFLMKRRAYKHIQTDVDLVFLDLNMPLMDGFDVLKEIRKNPRFQTLPIYVVTISRNILDISKALALGATGFYNKGSSSADIASIVREVYGRNFESTHSN